VPTQAALGTHGRMSQASFAPVTTVAPHWLLWLANTSYLQVPELPCWNAQLWGPTSPPVTR
jgi:hypothetical protein